MPAVVRVKRRIDEEPLSAFVLNSKRRRVDDNDEAAAAVVAATAEDSASGLANKEELSTLLKFAGTINEQDDSATSQFARLTKEEARELVLRKTRKPVNATEKARKEMRQNLQEQRFRVVNCLRTTLEDNESNGNTSRSKEITIVDIEKQTANDKTVTSTQTNLIPSIAHGNNEASTSAAAAAAAAAAAYTTPSTSSTTSSSSATTLAMMPTDSDTGYVYDLYIPDSEQHAEYVDLLDENYLRLQYPFNYYNEIYYQHTHEQEQQHHHPNNYYYCVRPFDDLIYEDRYNNDDDGDDDENDSEDSNQENYFGNDYPDEDDDPDAMPDSDDQDDDDDPDNLAKGLNKFVFGDDDDECDSLASSDDGDADNYYHAYRDPYVHTVGADEENFCADVDSCDVDRYGMAYARYKARILKRNQIKTGDDDEEDEVEHSFLSERDSSSSESYGYDIFGLKILKR